MQKEQTIEDVFTLAQKTSKKVLLTYFSGEQNLFLTKVCVPIQHFGRIPEKAFEFFYFWDDEADAGERLFGVPPSEIKYIELTDEHYDQKDYMLPRTGGI